MDYFKLILLITAYSLGIATLIVQIVCYLKNIEFKETILLTVSFLLMIISLTLPEFIAPGNHSHLIIQKTISIAAIIFLAFSIAVNIHRERILSRRNARNKITLVAAIICALAAMYLVSGEMFLEAYILSGILLSISVIYSMIIILRKPPSVILKYRDKTEKKTAWFVLFAMAVSTSIYFIYSKSELLAIIEQIGAYILSVICIVLTLSKLPGDIKRLMEFSKPKSIDVNRLKQYNISPREQEVLVLIIKGKTNKEIAGELFISLPTVKSHVSKIYEKLRVRNRLELSNLVKHS